MASKINKDHIIEYALATKDHELLLWAANKKCLKQNHIEAILDLVNNNSIGKNFIQVCLQLVDLFQSINIINKYKYHIGYINFKNALSLHKDKKDAPAINRIILSNINNIETRNFQAILQYKFLSSKIIHKILKIFIDWDKDIVYGCLQHQNISDKDKEKVLFKAKRRPFLEDPCCSSIVLCTSLTKEQYESFYNSVIHHGDIYTLARFAANPSIPQNIVDELEKHKSLIVQRSLCKSPLVSKEFIQSKIKEYRFHNALKKNKNLTKEQKEIISSTATVKDILE